MIYRADSRTNEIKLRLRRSGAHLCYDELSLHITPLQCEKPPEYCYGYTPCGEFRRVEIKREPPLTLVYDMFDYDEHGNVRFILDSQFAELACGRYVATVKARGCEVYKFQIDKRDKLQVADVIIPEHDNCCGG